VGIRGRAFRRETDMVQYDLLSVAFFVICILLSAFFSSAEVALISVSRARVRTLVNDGRPGATALAELRSDPDRILITTLVGTTLTCVAAAALATQFAIVMFGPSGVLFGILGTVLVLLAIGQIGPMLITARYLDGVALRTAGPVLILSRIVLPVVRVINRLSRSLGTAEINGDHAVTEDEIREWIDVGKEEGAIEQGEQVMLYNVLDFGETTAREVMTPRMDVTMVEDASTLESSLTVFHETGFSRLPVFHERVDNLVGVLNIKDVYSTIVSRTPDVRIIDLCYDPYFVPETKKIDDLLRELQLRRVPMAMVMDEYGGFVGIVTIEDILEELVGDILDEFDEEDPQVEHASEGVYLVDASIWVEDLNERMGIALPEGDSYETVGGLVIDRLGHIPHPGETVAFPDSGITLVVMQMRGKRIVRIKVLLPVPSVGENR
jgi:CBS domain containing-hemolysin-like protein